MSELYFRSGTWDENIWLSVARDDEYGLPARLDAADVVLDVGAHIGAFSYLALDRGAGLVIAVEPDTDNANSWRHNLHTVCRAEGRSILITAAAWRSDLPRDAPGVLCYAPVGGNTGGGNTLGEDGHPVRAVPLDRLIELAAALAPTGRVRLVKLDCEGAEWPCLLTCRRHDLVDEWTGEFHTIADPTAWPASVRVAGHERYDWHLLEAIFEVMGLDYRVDTSATLGKFRAWRARAEQGREASPG